MNRDWKYYFYQISKIPRKSGHEEKIKEYLVDFAKKRNYKYYTDRQNNVVIWKKTSDVNKNNEIIGLQAHTDMVCEKAKNSMHNFLKDSIELIEENGYIKAKDTTLGADNGIGVAYILSILDSTDIKVPNIEAIFTTQEETTMQGVKNIDESILLSKKIISFDNFNENEIWIGSASSQEWYTELPFNVSNIGNIKTYRLYLHNFIGGHAGMDIGDSKRGNPIKVAFEILKDANIMLNSVKSGSLINVIPRECEVIFSIKDSESIKDIEHNIQFMQNKYKNEKIELEIIKKQNILLSERDSKNIVSCINDFTNGAINRDNNGNVLVGANLAKVETETQKIYINFCVRGNKRVLTDQHVGWLENNIINKYNLKIVKYDEWKGFEQSSQNDLVQVCKKIYEREQNEKPNILGAQACLECEYLGLKIKDLQYVALGTNTYDAHSVKERVEIESVNRMWKVIIELLKYFYERG